jgi:hypothetical protein
MLDCNEKIWRNPCRVKCCAWATTSSTPDFGAISCPKALNHLRFLQSQIIQCLDKRHQDNFMARSSVRNGNRPATCTEKAAPSGNQTLPIFLMPTRMGQKRWQCGEIHVETSKLAGIGPRCIRLSAAALFRRQTQQSSNANSSYSSSQASSDSHPPRTRVRMR